MSNAPRNNAMQRTFVNSLWQLITVCIGSTSQDSIELTSYTFLESYIFSTAVETIQLCYI